MNDDAPDGRMKDDPSVDPALRSLLDGMRADIPDAAHVARLVAGSRARAAAPPSAPRWARWGWASGVVLAIAVGLVVVRLASPAPPIGAHPPVASHPALPPVERAVVEHAPIESAPVANTPVPNTPVPNTPMPSAPVANTPMTSTPVANTPMTSTPVANTPVASVVGAPSHDALPREERAEAGSVRPRVGAIDPGAAIEPAIEPGPAVEPGPAIDPASSAPAPEDEVALLAAARRALRADASRALTLVSEHEARFPTSAFAEERAVLRFDALLRTGRRDEAARAAEALLRRWPGSVHRHHIEESLAAP